MKLYFEALALAIARSIGSAWWAHAGLLMLAIFDTGRQIGYFGAMFFLFGLFYLFAIDDIRMAEEMKNEETR